MITLCMIVRDEAARLGRCLSSVRQLADEMVIVDTGSVDTTPALARAFGARVLECAWRDDFAAARNLSLEAATGDWILVLDADEWLTEADCEAIRELIGRSWTIRPILKLEIASYDDQDKVFAVHRGGRLFPNDRRLRFAGAMHERLVCSEGAWPEISCPGVRIHHDGYRLKGNEHKGERDRSLLARMRARQPDQPVWLAYLGDWHFARQAYEQALESYEGALAERQRLTPDDTALLRHALVRAMRCQERLGKPELALALPQQEACHGIPEYWYVRALLLRGLRRYAEARQALAICLGFREKTDALESYFPPMLSTLPLLQMLQLSRALSRHPHYDAVQRQQERLHMRAAIVALLQEQPTGEMEGLTHNLHTLLAEAVLDLPDPSSAYRAALPEAAQAQPLAEQIAALLKALPGHSDWAALARQVWPQDQPLTMAHLHLGMIHLQRPDLALELARLMPEKARAVLAEALLFFPDDQALRAALS